MKLAQLPRSALSMADTSSHFGLLLTSGTFDQSRRCYRLPRGRHSRCSLICLEGRPPAYRTGYAYLVASGASVMSNAAPGGHLVDHVAYAKPDYLWKRSVYHLRVPESWNDLHTIQLNYTHSVLCLVGSKSKEQASRILIHFDIAIFLLQHYIPCQ